MAEHKLEGLDLRVKIVSIKGTCNNGHKVGEEWLIQHKTPEGICLGAFATLLPFIHMLKFGGGFTRSTDPDTQLRACPDAKNAVVFEIKRIRE